MKNNEIEIAKRNKRIKRLHIILGFIFYFCGLFLIKSVDIENLKQLGVAHQEEFLYTDSEGEEYEDITLIDIKGVGKIFTYRDVYLEGFTMLILALIMGEVYFGRGEMGKCIIFAECIIGVLLLRLTTKANILPTILFWLCVVATYVADRITEKDNATTSR